MKKILLFTLLSFLLGVVKAQNNEEIKSKLNTLLLDAEAKDVFGGSVMVIINGQAVFEKNIGLADVEKNIPNTSATMFSLGSITKIFTKILILQLADEGKIRLADKIEQYLPGFADERAKDITIEQLTEHKAGLGDYAASSSWQEESEYINSITELLKHIQQQKLLFQPGSNVQYSNSGFVVLAALIEKITGKQLGEVYKERIFNRLQMNNSGFAYTNKDIPGKAVGYLTNFLGPKRNNFQFKEMGAGDGGLYSTTSDLWLFAQSIMNDNKLLKDEDKLRLFNTSFAPEKFADWKECKAKGRLSIAGGAPGVSAVLGLNLEKNYVIIVLSNYDQGSAELVAQRISAIVNNREYAGLPLPPARFIYSLIKEKGPDYFTDNYKTAFEKAGIPPDDDMVLLSAGKALLDEKNADAALALYSVYTKEFPNIVVAWNDMGDAYLLKGDKINAKKCFEQALKLRPGNPRAIRMLKELQ